MPSRVIRVSGAAVADEAAWDMQLFSTQVMLTTFSYAAEAIVEASRIPVQAAVPVAWKALALPSSPSSQEEEPLSYAVPSAAPPSPFSSTACVARACPISLASAVEGLPYIGVRSLPFPAVFSAYRKPSVPYTSAYVAALPVVAEVLLSCISTVVDVLS